MGSSLAVDLVTCARGVDIDPLPTTPAVDAIIFEGDRFDPDGVDGRDVWLEARFNAANGSTSFLGDIGRAKELPSPESVDRRFVPGIVVPSLAGRGEPEDIFRLPWGFFGVVGGVIVPRDFVGVVGGAIVQ